MVFNDNQAGRSQVKTIVYLRTLARAISLQSHSNNISTIAISYLFIAAINMLLSIPLKFGSTQGTSNLEQEYNFFSQLLLYAF